jgi:subtilisin family serine protease
MKKAGLLTLVVLGFAACRDNPAVAPSPQNDVATPELIPDRYIVVYHDDIRDAQSLTASLAARAGAKVHYSYANAIRGFAGQMSPEAAAELARDPRVKLVEQDQVMRSSTTQSGATWGIDRIDQRALPLSSTYTYSGTGAGVTAYIIDTGILIGHSEFGGRASYGDNEVIDATHPTKADAADCNGHGTHVSGTVGGATYGVAKNVLLVAVRVLSCAGSGSNSGVIAGVDWVTANHAPSAVANMSLGGGASTALDNAVSNSIASGVTYGIAAGNGFYGLFAQNACSTSPARVPSAITVSATDNKDTKPSWANVGTCVDIFAPGINITSSWYSSPTATNTISGTSMATPHVVGVAALYLEGHPGAAPSAVASALVAGATAGVVKSPGSGTPNRLLYTNY